MRDIRDAAREARNAILDMPRVLDLCVMGTECEDLPDVGVGQQRQVHADYIALDRGMLAEQILEAVRYPDHDDTDPGATIRDLLDRICEARAGVSIHNA